MRVKKRFYRLWILAMIAVTVTSACGASKLNSDKIERILNLMDVCEPIGHNLKPRSKKAGKEEKSRGQSRVFLS